MTPDEPEPLRPALTSLLDAERPLDAVPADTRARLLARVSASIAGAAATTAGTGAALKAAAGGKAAAGTVGASVTTKALIAAAAFSAGGGMGAAVHAVVAKPTPAPAPIVIRLEAPPEPGPGPTLAPAPAPDAPPPPAPRPRPARPAPDGLGAERSLVEQARAALARHDAAAALAALAQHEREFPEGQLLEERLALQVLGQVERGATARARELAQVFRARFPKSLLLPAVDAASPP